MSNEHIEKAYDSLFNVARKIIGSGEEHAEMCFSLKPSAEGYIPDKIYLLELPKPEDRNRAIHNLVRSAPQAYVVVHVDEAWVKEIDRDPTPEDLTTRLEGQPGAREALVFTFFREGQGWCAACPIDHKSRAIARGPIRKINPGDIQGRFASLIIR